MWVSGASAFVASIIGPKFKMFYNQSSILEKKFDKLPRNQEFQKTMRIAFFKQRHKLALVRTERELGGPCALLSKKASARKYLVRETAVLQILNRQHQRMIPAKHRLQRQESHRKFYCVELNPYILTLCLCLLCPNLFSPNLPLSWMLRIQLICTVTP